MSPRRIPYLAVKGYKGKVFAWSTITGDISIITLPQLTTLNNSKTFGEDDCVLGEQSDRGPNHSGAAHSALLNSHEHSTSIKPLLITEAELKGLIEQRASCLGQRKSSIALIGIPTKDRPNALKRCLNSLIRNLRQNLRQCSLIVADGSSTQTFQKETSDVVKNLDRPDEITIEYIGNTEKEHLLDAFRRAGIPEDIGKFCLFGSSFTEMNYGANRNALLLRTAGNLWLSCDDDTVPGFGYVENGQEASLYQHCEPYLTRAHSTRATAIERCKTDGFDLLALHEAYLGKSIVDLLSSVCPSFRNICDCMLASTASGDGRVLLTSNGFCGDSATQRPRSILLTDNVRTQEYLSEDKFIYDTYLNSREVVRNVRHTMLGHGSSLYSVMAGFDNRRFLPPFFPCGRAEDALMGAMACLPGTDNYFANLPLVVGHFPAKRRDGFGTEYCDFSNTTSLIDILAPLVHQATRNATSFELSAQMQIVAAHFAALGGASSRKFAVEIRNARMIALNREIQQITSLLDCGKSIPEYWRDDLFSRLLSIESSVANANFCLPREIPDSWNAQERYRVLKAVIGLYGGLLRCWPTMIEIASTFRKDARPNL